MERKWEDVPDLLAEILDELKRLNRGTEKPKIEQPKKEKKTQTADEENENSKLTHDQLKDLCLKLNRDNPANKDRIKTAIAKFTDGKLMDVPMSKLPELKTEIEAAI